MSIHELHVTQSAKQCNGTEHKHEQKPSICWLICMLIFHSHMKFSHMLSSNTHHMMVQQQFTHPHDWLTHNVYTTTVSRGNYGDVMEPDTTSRPFTIVALTGIVSVTPGRSHTSALYWCEPKISLSTSVVIANEKIIPQNMPSISENAAIMPATPLCLSATFLQQWSTCN